MMSYVACMEQTGAEIRRRLSEPGLLRGRQRSPAFVDGIVKVGLFIARHHALADFTHIFPIARMKIQGMVEVPEWLIRRAIPVLRLIGFIELDRQIVRRIHAGTKSLTPGSNPAWYCPGQYTLDSAIRRIFGRKDSFAPASFPVENQCDQDEITNLSKKESEEGDISLSSPFLVALPPEPLAVPAPKREFVPLPSALDLSIARALEAISDRRPVVPVIPQTQHTRVPLPTKIATAVLNSGRALLGARTIYNPQAPGLTVDALAVKGDQSFKAEFPEVIRISPDLYPKLYDEADGNMLPEVYDWVAEHCGVPGRDHGIRWFQQPDVTPAMRKSGMGPAELFESYGVIRDVRIGFKSVGLAVEFAMRWKGTSR